MLAEINLTPTGSNIQFTYSSAALAKSGAPGDGIVEQSITGRTWGDPTRCKAAVLLVHGVGAHSGWFEAVGRQLKVRHVFALAYDQLGFGKRKNEKFVSWRQWVSDLEAAHKHLRSLVGDKPIFIVGNSMGALVSLQAAPRLKHAGLTLSSPAFKANSRLFSTWFLAKGLLKAWSQPDLDMNLPYGVEEIARDEQVRSWLSNDPQKRFAPSGRMMLEILKLTNLCQQSVAGLSCPILVMEAGNDKIVDNAITDKLFEKMVSKQKARYLFGDAYHDLMFDPVIDEVTEKAVNWMIDLTN